MGFPGGSAGKESTWNVGDLGSIHGLGRSPGEGKGFPLQYSDLENSTECIVHGVTKSHTWLSNFHKFLQRSQLRVLLGIALNLYTSLASIAILMLVNLVIHDHGASFYLFGCLIFFPTLFFSFKYMFWISLASFIPMYFIIFTVLYRAVF